MAIEKVNQKSNGTPALILHYKGCTRCLVKRNEKTGKIRVEKLGFSKCAFNCESKNNINDINTGDIMTIMEKNNQKKYKSKLWKKNKRKLKKEIFSQSVNDINKLSVQRSNYYTAQSIGNTFGHFISNVDKFINASASEKIKMAGASSIPIAIEGLEKGTKFIGNYSKTAKNISNKIPLVDMD